MLRVQLTAGIRNVTTFLDQIRITYRDINNADIDDGTYIKGSPEGIKNVQAASRGPHEE